MTGAVTVTRFLNLSAGVLWASRVGGPFGFVRIQSTACEQKRWAAILDELDSTLLVPLALGIECVVYDCGARKTISRAVWQGLPWIRYALAMTWIGHAPRPVVRGHNVETYFAEQFRALPDKTIGRLRYFAPLADGLSEVRLSGESFAIEGINPSGLTVAESLRPAPRLEVA